MVSGTARGLLMLYRGLTLALTMDAFPRLTLLALGADPLLVTLFATPKALLVVPTVPLCFHTSSLEPWHSRVSRARQQHFPAAWSPQQPLT